MSQILNDDFSKLGYEGWQRVAGQYLDCWANLTKNFEPLLNAAKVIEYGYSFINSQKNGK